MKVRLLLVFTLLFWLDSLLAQAPPWHWARQGATSGTESALDMCTDAISTNVYVCGSFDGNLGSVYGSSLTATNGLRDAFLIKYDVNGNLLWGFNIGGVGNEEMKGVVTDPFGDVYTLGTFSGICDFDPSAGTFTLASSGRDGFLAKYSSAGVFQWAIKYGSTMNDNAWGIDADANGVYITGSFTGISTFYSTNGGNSMLVSQGNEDLFGAKYSYGGVLQWTIAQGETGSDIGYEVVADNSGVYFIGTYTDDLNVYGASGAFGTSIVSQQSGMAAVVVSAYSSAGVFLWCNNITSSDNNAGLGIEQDLNNIYITGSISNTASFKYPNPSFTQTAAGADIYLAKLSKLSGQFLWVSSQTGSSVGFEVGYDLQINRNTLLLTGMYSTLLDFQGFGGPLLVSMNADPFLSCFDLSGNFLWTAPANGLTNDLPTGLAVNDVGGIFVCGSYGSGINFGNISLGAANNTNIFVAKMGCDSVFTNTISPAAQTICSGNSPSVITGTFSTGSNYSIQWQSSPDGLNWTNAPGTATNTAYTSPALTSSTYFRRVISASGTCTNSMKSSTVIIKVDQQPQADAGGDVFVCIRSLSTTINAVAPSVGTGSWSVVSGPVTINNPTAPTSSISGLTLAGAVLQWVVNNGVCSASTSSMTVNVVNAVSQAVAGSNQSICATTTTLSANTPSSGVGFWSILSGSASFITTSMSSANVAIGSGTNSFLWTVANGVCPSTYDTVLVIVDPLPPPAFANVDQTVCTNSVALNAAAVATGTSSWQLMSGAGIFNNQTLNTATVDSLAIGKNVFRWTVQSGTCPLSFDEVTIWRDAPSEVAFAGNNQQVEIPVAQLSAAVPSIGVGYWTVVQGNGDFENDTKPATKITGLSVGNNVLRWTVRNASCPVNSSDVTIYLEGLKIPSGFSPNGDGINDTFVVPGLEYYGTADFSVFNRWGALVYHNAAYSNAWNGSNMSNAPLVDDTYYFTLTISEDLKFNGYIIIKAAK